MVGSNFYYCFFLPVAQTGIDSQWFGAGVWRAFGVTKVGMHATAGLVPMFRHKQRAILQALSNATGYSRGVSADW